MFNSVGETDQKVKNKIKKRLRLLEIVEVLDSDENMEKGNKKRKRTRDVRLEFK